MPTIKTAISLPKAQFADANALARKMKVSRSRVFQIALEEYVARRRDADLIARINAAHANGLTAEDRALLEISRRMAAKRLQKDEW